MHAARLRGPYSDKASIFRVGAKEAVNGAGSTQFGRGLSELKASVRAIAARIRFFCRSVTLRSASQRFGDKEDLEAVEQLAPIKMAN